MNNFSAYEELQNWSEEQEHKGAGVAFFLKLWCSQKVGSFSTNLLETIQRNESTTC